jgi:phytoene desaturase
MRKNVAVIGAGFSGLSTACYLARDGYGVTVYESHGQPGGRARVLEAGGFRFDMGPSWYWMPDIIERFFADFGKQPSDYYSLKRLDPGYRIFFPGESADIPATMAQLEELFEKLEPGSASRLRSFLGEAGYKYHVGMRDLAYRPGQRISELLDRRLLFALFRLQLFGSLHKHIRRHFRDPRIISILEFPSLFLGALPANTPALYSLMNYADLVKGTWYPLGGMSSLVRGVETLASELGVQFSYNTDVSAINVEERRARSISTNKGVVNGFEAMVSSADYHFTDQQLLAPRDRRYDTSYWNSRKMAPSSLIFFLGVKGSVRGLIHHNLFFDRDFESHARSIYTSGSWPEKPLFYVCAPSKSDNTVAPPGHENLFVLVPLAPGLRYDQEKIDSCFAQVCARILSRTGFDVQKNLVFRQDYGHDEFVRDYHAFRGNAYGLANTLFQTAHLKPDMRHKKVKNLFMAGQLTVPGPGVPPALISGKLAAGQLVNYLSK